MARAARKRAVEAKGAFIAALSPHSEMLLKEKNYIE